MAQKTHKTHPPSPASRQKGETTTPTNLLKLMEAVGPSRASRELGVSTTTLHKAKKYNMVSKSIEVAARAVLLDMVGEMSAFATQPAPQASAPSTQRRDTTMFMLEVETPKAGVVEKFAEMLQAKLLRA